MALVLDVVTPFSGGPGGDKTISHPAAASGVKAALVHVVAPMNTDLLAGANYGTIPMTGLGPALSQAGLEDGLADIFFLGSGIPQGTQDVFIDITSGTPVTAGAIITLTGDRDTEIFDTEEIESDGATNPTVGFHIPPNRGSAFVSGCIWTDHDSVASIAPGVDDTQVLEVDFGTETGGVSRRTSMAPEGSVTYSWTLTLEEVAMIATAVLEVEAVAGFAPPPRPRQRHMLIR